MPTTTADVHEIAAHEEQELERVRAATASLRTKEEELKKEHARQEAEAEQQEKVKTNAELQKFAAEDIPLILQKGERERLEAVERVENSAKKVMPSVLASVVAQASESTLVL